MAGNHNAIVMAAQTRHSNVWTHEQRVCVHILWDEHSLSKEDRAKVFNNIFKVELANCGIHHPGLKPTSISIERSKRLVTGSSSWAAWQLTRNIPDDVGDRSALARMRRHIVSLVTSNGGVERAISTTPPRRSSDTVAAQAISPVLSV